MAQWLRIRLPVRGTRVQFLVREDSKCRGAAESMCCNCWSPCALEPALCSESRLREEKPTHHHCRERAQSANTQCSQKDFVLKKRKRIQAHQTINSYLKKKERHKGTVHDADSQGKEWYSDYNMQPFRGLKEEKDRVGTFARWAV